MSPELRQAPALESPFNRFVGAAIDDGLWFAVAAYVLGYLPASVYDNHPEVVWILLIALASLWLNYFAFCESKWGKTVGKHVMGMRVLADDGSKASFGACSVRNVMRPLDYLIIGPVMIAATARHQRLGDKLGQTIVVSERPPTVPAEAGRGQQGEDSPLTDREHMRLAERRDPVATPPSWHPGRGYATIWRRGLAFLIDLALVAVVASIALAVPGTSLYDEKPELAGLIFLAIASAAFNYFAISEWKWGGRTVGKRILGIRVLGEDGEQIGFAAASMRNLMRLIDFFFLLIGPILIIGGKRRQRLGDQVAHTVVVRGEWAPGEPEPAGESVPEEAGGKRGKLPDIDWDFGQTILGVVVGLLLAALVAPLLALPIDPDLLSNDENAHVALGATLVAQASLTVALLGTALYVARQRDAAGSFDLGATVSGLGWRRFNRNAIGQLLATLFIYFVLAALISTLLVSPHQKDIASMLGLDRGFWLAALAALLICVVAPIAEETFFRGFLFSGLRQRLSRLPAALVSGLVFGGVHAPTGPTAVIPLAILGTGLALLYERTGSIWPGVIAHALNNSLALAVAG